MTPLLRMTRKLHGAMVKDLQRPHRFASERVGFLRSRSAPANLLSLAFAYTPVPDDRYVPKRGVGACIDEGAIREAMQTALNEASGCFHVHLHDHEGEPWFSGVDQETALALAPSLLAVSPHSIHGAVVLSRNSASTLILAPGADGIISGRVSIVGHPTRVRGGIDGERLP
jgi:hypothetical protein